MSPQLGLDIQAEIIKRLPVKSLIQFRSVCREWKSLIDSSKFIAGHVCHDQPQHLMISYEDGYGGQRKVNYVSFVDDDTFPKQKFAPTVPPLLQLLHNPRIIDSSCGLFCLDDLFRERDNSKTNMVVFWNPSIRKSIAVAVPNVDYDHYNSVVGFGVCPYTKDPKLVCIRYIDNENPYQVMVFTLSSGEWRRLCNNQVPRQSIQFDDCYQTVIGQFIYWRADDWSDYVDDDDFEPRSMIMSFDLSNEEFRKVDLPDGLLKLPGKWNFLVSRLRESLIVVEYSELDDHFTWKQACTFWMMEHGDSKVFTKLFTINPPNLSVSQARGFRKSGEPIVERKDCLQNALVVYEPCSEHIMELGIRGNKCSFYGSSYTESLLLLDHDDGRIVGVEL